MRYHFYILFSSAALLFLAVSCHKQKAPDFQDSESMLVLQACEAIANGDEKQMMLYLEELKLCPEPGKYAQEIELAIKRYFNSKRINQLIEEQNFAELKLLIDTLKKNGDSSIRLLYNDDLPAALQELTHFCQGMPWQNADALELALSQLEPYQNTLSQSQAFQNLMQQQNTRLAQLRQEEAAKKTAFYMNALEMAALKGDISSWRLSKAEYMKAFPTSQLPQLEYAIMQCKPVKTDNTVLYADAIIGNWNGMNSKQRKTALAYSTICKEGRCANVLDVMRNPTASQLEKHIQYMKAEGLPPAKLAVQAYVQTLAVAPDKNHSSPTRTNQDILGLKNIIDFCSSITIEKTKGN